jgi:hypothetical protein
MMTKFNRAYARFSSRALLAVLLSFISIVAQAQTSETTPVILTSKEWALVQFPIVFYCIATIFGIAFLLRGENWKRLICEKRITKIHGDESTVYFLSLSRLALFLAGLTASMCAVVCTSFFIYHSLKKGNVPDMTSLAAIITAVQIGGALPYLGNQFKKDK